MVDLGGKNIYIMKDEKNSRKKTMIAEKKNMTVVSRPTPVARATVV